jgi:hypothetical protein
VIVSRLYNQADEATAIGLGYAPADAVQIAQAAAYLRLLASVSCKREVAALGLGVESKAELRAWVLARLAESPLKCLGPKNAASLQQYEARFNKSGLKGIARGHEGKGRPAKAKLAETIVLSMATKNKSFYPKMLLEKYNLFLQGKLEVVDTRTGELINPDGYPQLGIRTVYNILSSPAARAAMTAVKAGQLRYNAAHRPARARKLPQFSLSMISMDDKVAPFTNRHNYYLICDVNSGAIIGWSCSRSKDAELMLEALRNMFFDFLPKNCDGRMPLELQAERHLAWGYRETMFKPGALFTHMYFCRGGNPNEKYAESIVKNLRYQQEVHQPGYLHRPGARHATLALNPDAPRVAYSDAEVVELFRQAVLQHNAAAHPHYRGLSRLEALQANLNPDCQPMDWLKVAYWLGYRRKTSINRNNLYFSCDNREWIVEKTDQRFALLEMGRFEAVYIPGQAKTWVFGQRGELVGEFEEMPRYQMATAERTSEDYKIFAMQNKIVAGYDDEIGGLLANIQSTQEVVPASPKPPPRNKNEETTPDVPRIRRA